ncbi:unnamed protein product [Phaedon cochleariae]|uniref:Cuticular protein n=1 Tax=Phaedon cochleariae TaxID=80249 RepID=A0A9N9SI87_PHACE|nr:unnamed protein product [Phaedon cochleariae]
MALDAIQLVTILLLAVIYGDAVKPPGYVEPQQKEPDSRPPRYEYGYNVNTDEGSAEQGKQEERDGIYASGRYYVQGKDSNQDVRYFADDWGFHPAVEYSNAGPHSKSRARFALGFEAVQQLKNKENNQPQLQGLPETGNLNKQGPQVLLRNSEPTIQGQHAENSQHFSSFQSNNQESQRIEENQQQQTPEPQTDFRNPQQPLAQFQQQIVIQEQPSNNAYNREKSKNEPAENVVYPQQPENLSFGHQQILVFPNQQQQTEGISIEKQAADSQENLYEQQGVNEVIETENLDQNNYQEFGLKINPTKQKPNNKLIETTQHLVSGQDVLDINSAITKQQETSIESSTVQYSTVNQESNKDNPQVTYVSTTPCPSTQNTFKEQPIVVADYEEGNAQYSSSTIQAEEQAESFSTTAKSVESFSTTYESPSTIVVTPRPISTQFLAPITAGIRLQNIEHYEQNDKTEQKSNEYVQIQESVPYYLGKFEYPVASDEQVSANYSFENSIDYRAKGDLELGKILLLLPEPPRAEKLVQRPFDEVDNHLTAQQLPNSQIKDQFQEAQRHVESSAQITGDSLASTQIIQDLQQQISEYQHKYRENNQKETSENDNKNSNLYRVHLTQNPPEITRIIQQPYPVRVPYEVPYPVVKQIPVPVTYQRVVEKPVHITKYVEKPVPVPQPYPVEKVVEKPVHIPVQVTRYIDRPYPVEVRVPYPQPYPVEKLVHNIIRQPYPVEVKVPYPVEKIVEKKVHVPHYIDKPVTVEKIVEKPVTHYVDRPYPVEKIVEKPVPHYVDRPYPVEVKVPVPQPFYVRVEVPRPHPIGVNQAYQRGLYQHILEQNAQQSQQQAFFSNPYAYAPQINQYLPPRKEIVINNGYLPPKQFSTGYLPPATTADCTHGHTGVNSNDHIGLLPPRIGDGRTYMRRFRSARQFDDNSVRMEYGFMPPMVPSLEIDDKGNPIEKGEK